MADEFDVFARVLGSLIVSFFALLASWTALVGFGTRTPPRGCPIS